MSPGSRPSPATSTWRSTQARADAGRGVVPPDFIIDKTITQTRALREQHGEQADLVQSLVRRAREKNIQGDWARQASAIVDGRLAAALDRQLALLTELRRGAGHNPAASRLPGGATFYAQCLRFHTSTGMSPDEVHETGLRQIAELGAEAEPLLRAAGPDPGQRRPAADRARPAGAAPLSEYGGRADRAARQSHRLYEPAARPDAGMLRHDPALADGDPAGAAGDRARGAARLCAGAEPRWLAARRLLYQSARHPLLAEMGAADADPSRGRAGPSLAGLARDREPVDPACSTAISASPLMREGWGLYAEQLADEIGMYRDYQVGRLGMIQSFMYRAARLVTDSGMHAKGWSREQSIRFFMENVGLDELSSTSEIERYVRLAGPGLQLQDRP